jgi:hypothetical protein
VGYNIHTKAYWLFNPRIKVIISRDVEFNETHVGLNMDKVLAHLSNSLLELSIVDIKKLSQGVFPLNKTPRWNVGISIGHKRLEHFQMYRCHY